MIVKITLAIGIGLFVIISIPSVIATFTLLKNGIGEKLDKPTTFRRR